MVADLPQPLGRLVEGDVPRHLFEHLASVGGIDGEYRGFRETGFAYQRFGQPLRMIRVVEAVAPLDAQAGVVRPGRPSRGRLGYALLYSVSARAARRPRPGPRWRPRFNRRYDHPPRR